MSVGFLVLFLFVGASGSAEPPASGIGRIAWLQGCWELASSDLTIEEQWMAPRGKSMIGVSRTVRDGRLAGYELILIQEQDGLLAYQAHPSGQQSATFMSSQVSDTSVVFENPEHEFPQRIGYQSSGPESLLAWIDGTLDGKERRIEFPYTRAECGGKAGIILEHADSQDETGAR